MEEGGLTTSPAEGAVGAEGATGTLVTPWQDLQDSARAYVLASKAANTRRAYAADLANFRWWCGAQGVDAVPAAPQTLCLYVTALAAAGAKTRTIERRLAALSQAHQLAGHIPPPTADPLVRLTMAGIRRTHGKATTKKTALVTAQLRRLVAHVPAQTLAGHRDRALLLLGFAGAFRRSELVALDGEDVQETEDGLRVQIRWSKTDQEGVGRTIGIPYGQHPATCPVRALRAWRAVSGIAAGPLFRPINRHDQLADRRLTDQSVALIVKRAVSRAGLEPATYAGHSLRAGFATAAAAGGAPDRAIMRQTGHRSAAMLREYIQAGSLFHENAVAYVGL